MRYRQNFPLFIEKELCPYDPYGTTLKDLDKESDAYKFLVDMSDMRNLYAIMACGRGQGKTVRMSMVGTTSAVLYPTYEVLILGGSLEQSSKAYEYNRAYFEGNPKLAAMVDGEIRRTKTDLLNASSIQCVTCSSRQVRSKHPALLLGDEICEAEKTKEGTDTLKAAINGARVSTVHGRIVFGSTAHKFFGLFRKYWDNAPKWNWKRYHWDCYDCSWIKPAAIKQAILELGEDSVEFKVEWLGMFALSVGAVFHPPNDDWGTYIETKEISRRSTKGLSCVLGLDYGQDHPSAWSIWQDTGIPVQVGSRTFTIIECLASEWYRFKPYSKLLKRVHEVYKLYHVNKVYADSNYPGENQRLAEMGVNVEPVYSTTLS